MLGFQNLAFLQGGTLVLGFQKVDIFTRGDPCVGNSKTDNFIRGYPYISLKYHFKNAEKEGGLCVRGYL